MVKTADAIELDADEQAIVDAFDDSKMSTVVEVMSLASRTRPASLVREAYWELVSEGLLVPSASGVVRLKF